MDRQTLDILLHLRDGNCPYCGVTLKYDEVRKVLFCPVCSRFWHYGTTQDYIREHEFELDQL